MSAKICECRKCIHYEVCRDKALCDGSSFPCRSFIKIVAEDDKTVIRSLFSSAIIDCFTAEDYRDVLNVVMRVINRMKKEGEKE